LIPLDIYIYVTPSPWEKKTMGVCHIATLPFYIKKYLKAKEEVLEIQIFSHAKNYKLQTNPLKETKILQDVITL
jgi:adenylosuccinate synthase